MHAETSTSIGYSSLVILPVITVIVVLIILAIRSQKGKPQEDSKKWE